MIRISFALPLIAASLAVAQSSGNIGGTPVFGVPGGTPAPPVIRLPRWDAARARVLAGSGQARVQCKGDSTTAGIGVTGQGPYGLKTGAYCTHLAKLIAATGVPANTNSFAGGQPNDPRASVGAWARDFGGADGYMFFANGAATLTFTPTGNVDTFRVWYPQVGNVGVFTVSIDGGPATTVNTSGGPAWSSVTVNAASPGAHTVSIAWQSGYAYFAKIEAFNSTSPSIIVENDGWPSSSSNDWAATGNNVASPGPGSVIEAPDLILLVLGINDWVNGSTPLATFRANMQSLITQWKAVSDVVLITPIPSQIGSTSLATQQAYIAVLQQLAVANNIPLVDNWTRWGNPAVKAAAPYNFYFDNLHANETGYADFARGVFQVIK